MNSGYVSPLSDRYASNEMQYLFSQDTRFRTYRRLWLSLAKAQKTLGLPITDEQIEELESNLETINYDDAIKREEEIKHDVMAHIYAYGLQCPRAKGIIHLGATSCYVTDNTDIIVMTQALRLIRTKLAAVLSLLCSFADKYKDVPTLGMTHLQPAQLTTVGKRAALWMSELVTDLEEVTHRLGTLPLLGSKGTTGTQASFVELFEGETEKIDELERLIAKDLGYDKCVEVSGQTYSRKLDANVLSTLSGIAQTASKFANDIRILQSFKEIEEPFGKEQVGSSAMPYKRNPMKSERITALARFVISLTINPAITAATQWFERTLDDSANKRLAVSEAFLGVDAILNLMLSVCDGLVVYPRIIERRVMAELPFMATENIMMAAVKKGGDRGLLHHRLREHSMLATKNVKEHGGENDLIDRICGDSGFNLSRDEVDGILKPSSYTGRACEQTKRYIENVIKPILELYSEDLKNMKEDDSKWQTRF